MEEQDLEGQIIELIEQLRSRRWSDGAIARELGVAGTTVHRWRHHKQGITMPKLVKRALEDLMAQP